MPTKTPRKNNLETEEHVLDASTVSFGRLATRAAELLQGKHRVDYAPNIDFPVTVRVENIKQIKISGRKTEQKLYYRYTGYPGGLKTVAMSEYLAKEKPRVIFSKAVQNMLPKNRLRDRRMRRLIFSE
ncbi:MAG: 50S ribosomal protein L13 [bacterium]|nr:50S ribosomal protein L13 [bacterium]